MPNPNQAFDLSILIVTYKSLEHIGPCIEAVFASKTKVKFEVVIVDNSGNVDGTVDFVNPQLVSRYPNIQIISSSNIGFGKGNNKALEMARGKDILLLNPDTRISPDTIEEMAKFLAENDNVGIATCKLVRPDGTLDKACRRSIPDPWISLARLSGLSLLFPKSKLFAKYNLTFKDENEDTEIEACTGAFMFIRREVLDKLEWLFDPEYFMYGEDLDLCVRAKTLGYKIWYHPKTSTINFKGQSSKKESALSNFAFHEAMWIFYRKNIAFKYPKPFNWLVYIGIWSRYWLKRMILAMKKEKVVSK